MQYSVIRLNVEWAERYAHLRLTSLKERPQNFCMTYAEQSAWSTQDYQNHLSTKQCYGMVQGEALVAIATMSTFSFHSMQHKVLVSEVYVDPVHRGHGLARQLLSQVIHDATEAGYTHMQLSVESENPTAIQLYESLGFVQFGYEEASICLDGVAYDDIWMVKQLQEKA